MKIADSNTVRVALNPIILCLGIADTWIEAWMSEAVDSGTVPVIHRFMQHWDRIEQPFFEFSSIQRKSPHWVKQAQLYEISQLPWLHCVSATECRPCFQLGVSVLSHCKPGTMALQSLTHTFLECAYLQRSNPILKLGWPM